MAREMVFGLRIARIFLALSVPAALFALVNFALLALKYCCNRGHLFGLGPLLKVDAELTFPTLYSVLLWFLAASVALLIGFAQRSQQTAPTWPWLTLGCISMAAGADEFVSLHERTWPSLLEVPGWESFYAAWTLPIGAIALLSGVVYLRFFLKLSRPVQLLWGTGFVVFMLGAVGCELLGNWVILAKGHQLTPLYHSIAIVEELLEMQGIILFTCGLLAFWKENYRTVAVISDPCDERS